MTPRRAPPRESSAVGHPGPAAHSLLVLVTAVACAGGLGCSLSEYFVTAGESDTTGTDTAEPDPCLNGIREPWESDVDCGGPICEACGVGYECKVNADCDTAICAQGLCSDNPCDLADPCPLVAAPCLTSSCDPELGCLLEPVPNGDPCGPERPDDPPPLGGLCWDGLCLAPCGECEILDGPCRQGICDGLSGECGVLWAPENAPCVTEDGIDEGTCVEGTCETALTDSVIFFYDFEDPDQGFDMDEPWEIGAAMLSRCSAQGIEDPAVGVGQENDGVAGLLIGECLPSSAFAKSCLTSPVIELPFPGSPSLRYWEIIDLPEQVTRGTVELSVGGAWAEVHEVPPERPEWTEQVVPLGPIDEPLLQLRFCFETSGEIDSYSGWSIDNMEVTCPECAP